MLEPLDGECNGEGGDGCNSRPETKVAEPDRRVADYLRGGLENEVGDNSSS